MDVVIVPGLEPELTDCAECDLEERVAHLENWVKNISDYLGKDLAEEWMWGDCDDDF